jgi:pSer/pThr/pTyr-binding forkhead associated (FHA) protein
MQLITIGKDPSNKIVLNHPYISGRHAEIKLRDDGSIFITDKSSTNGTTLRGRKLQKEDEVSVNRGDKITFADVKDLDWSKIPVITPPPPGWHLYSIGSDLNNRIQITDASDRISRFHATLKIDPKGKIYLNDHSSNGTYVGDQRIPSNQDYRIKRKAKVLFANVAPLDWSRIKAVRQPLSLPRIAAALAVAAIIGVVAFGWFAGWFNPKWSLEKTHSTYSNSIVHVYHAYRIVVMNTKGTKFYWCKDCKPESGEEGDWVAAGSEKAAKGETVFGGMGTAFLVDREGFMVTNRHIAIPWEGEVKKHRQLAKAEFIDGKVEGETVFIGVAFNQTSISGYGDLEECSVISKTTDDELKDVGLLKLKNLKQLPLNFTPVDLTKAVLDSKHIAIGQPLYLIGYPGGTNMLEIISDKTTTNTVEVKLTSQTGAVSQLPDKYKFGHSAASFGGSSGSPVFNDRGQLIGIHNSGLSSAGIQGYGWAILAKHAKELYDKEKN